MSVERYTLKRSSLDNRTFITDEPLPVPEDAKVVVVLASDYDRDKEHRCTAHGAYDGGDCPFCEIEQAEEAGQEAVRRATRTVREQTRQRVHKLANSALSARSGMHLLVDLGHEQAIENYDRILERIVDLLGELEESLTDEEPKG